MQTNLRIDHHLLAVEHEHSVSGMLELVVPAAPKERLPLHIALVIDCSGSMSGAKLEAAKDAAWFLVRQLDADDRLAIVTFDSTVDLVMPLAAVDAPVAEQIIERIVVGSQTNLSGGWLKGVEELGRGTGADAIRRVVLLTDGQANVGIVDPTRLVALAGGAKVATTTIGFGDGFDEDLLQQIADASGGATYYVESPEDAPGVFAEEFEGLATVVAQNVSVEIVMLDDAKFIAVLNDYPLVDVPDGFQAQLGDVFGGERRQVLFQFWIPEVAALGVRRVAELTIRYVTVGEQCAHHEVKVPVTVNLVTADEAERSKADRYVVEQVTILNAARALRASRDIADRGDLAGARDLLSTHAESLRSCGGVRSIAEAELLEQHASRLEAYDPGVRKLFTSHSYRTSRGRPTRSEVDEG